MKYDCGKIDFRARELFKEERGIKRLDGWFLLRESITEYELEHEDEYDELRTAKALYNALKTLPLSLSENAIFAGTQRDAFAQSYALINPNFKVSTFNGYCDPTAVFNDIEPCEEIPSERIERLRKLTEKSPYVKSLKQVYESIENDTKEVIYFVEQVTGHIIPDFRPVLKNGLNGLRKKIDERIENESDERKVLNLTAMKTSLDCASLLAVRYKALAEEQCKNADQSRMNELERLIDALDRVPNEGARNLFEAIQSFMLLWQVMCLEQAPNPFAFSVGNADRIFEEYRLKENLSREEAAALFKHFLLFFNVGSRSWAISQNVIVGGKGNDGNDLTNETSYALLDAYYAMNFPQPILSVKLHRNTPEKLYREMGRFMFTPGCLTPSFFNDDAVFAILSRNGVKKSDLPDYSVAGCQEPLIMGKDNGNTTNSWLNLPKILELVLNGGVSEVTGERLNSGGNFGSKGDSKALLENVRELFYRETEYYVDKMTDAADRATKALSHLKVPFLSSFMGGIETAIDMRDTTEQGTEYNGSGCLIHGLSVVADSFVSIDELLKNRPQDCDRLLEALKTDFVNDEELRKYLMSCPKYGNGLSETDEVAADIAEKISKTVRKRKNYLGNPFRPDWSSPTTHLLYGYWVGATPDGRKAREMLNYGVDPLFGTAENGLGFRMLSLFKLDFMQFNGGYASHLGLDPKYFKAASMNDKGVEFRDKIIRPLFFSNDGGAAPFYLYVNVTTPEILRKVLADHEKYAPSGVYIMRIHGTFVNFLDLSPDVQEDIIKRLDLASTVCC